MLLATLKRKKGYSMEIRLAREEDLNQILEIYKHAREFMVKNNNPTQWGSDYPNADILREDIKRQELFVEAEGEEIHGAFVLAIGEDPTYLKIYEGEWISDTTYSTIHRIATKGIYKGMFERVITYCIDMIPHLRIDTHADNKIMQHLIEKNGFKKCGVIYVRSGGSRIAYEKV